MFVVIILVLLLAGCSDNKAAPVNRQAQAAPVYVSKAVLKRVPIEIETVGNVEAYSTVTVKAQVGGELTIVDFQEGADIRRSEEHTSELQSPCNLVCRLLLEKKKARETGTPTHAR